MAEDPSSGPKATDLIGLGATVAGCIALGVGGGYWLGSATGSGSVVTFAGLGLGLVAAAAASYVKIKRYL
ncbi:MAG: AtpZ/AtpI family protein [Actinomycetota bacterium]|nr:AtpZ/AtpI family protein [Actinomycetota bacterium]